MNNGNLVSSSKASSLPLVHRKAHMHYKFRPFWHILSLFLLILFHFIYFHSLEHLSNLGLDLDFFTILTFLIILVYHYIWEALSLCDIYVDFLLEIFQLLNYSLHPSCSLRTPSLIGKKSLECLKSLYLTRNSSFLQVFVTLRNLSYWAFWTCI